MFRNLLSFVLTRRPIVLLGLMAFMATGLLAFYKLNVEAYPNPAPVILEITAQVPGLSAEEMERYYSRPMEIGLATTLGVDNIRSTSFYGLSFVRVTFKYDVSYSAALSRTAINLQQNVNLPNNVQPQIQASSLVGEILRYQVVGPSSYSLTDLRGIQDWIIQRRLLTVTGVAQVVTWGGTTKEYHVEVEPRKLEGFGLTLQQVLTAIGNANSNVGGRTVSVGEQSVNIRGLGLVRHIEDVGNIVLSQQNGIPVRVKDIGEVTLGTIPRLGEAGRDASNDAVTGVVVMNRTMQTKDVIERVKKAVEQINTDGSLPDGVQLQPYYDRSTLVNVTTHTVIHNLIFGCVLVFLIQWLFLGDLRSAVIVSMNIPFALFFSIIMLVLTGESANLLSLGAVDFGIIVDSAVILVENIFRNFQQTPDVRYKALRAMGTGPHAVVTDPAMGWTERLRTILLSALQVDNSVLFSTVITIAAFSPLFLMTGVEGQIFGPMARTYGYALAGALLATFTITPVLAAYLLPRRVQEHETRIVAAIRKGYEPMLRWTLRNARLTWLLAVAFLVVVCIIVSRLGSEFLPALEEGNLWIRASMPPTITLEAGTAKANRMREIIKSYPEVATVVSQHGRPDDGSDASGFNNVELFAPLKPFDEWPVGMTKEKLVAELQAKFAAEFPGVGFNFSQYIQDNVEEGLSGVKGANSVKIVGPDLVVLEQLASQVIAVMAKVPGATDLGVFNSLGQPNLNIQIDREKAARYGLNTGDVNATIQAALGGTSATTVLEGERQYGLTVRYDPRSRKDLESLRELRVGYSAAGGTTAFIPLRDIATITLDTGATYIYHERNERFIPIKFSVRGRDLGSTVAEIEERIGAEVKLPSGYRILYAGEFEELQQAKSRMAILIPMAIALILVLLYALFSSFIDSLLTLGAVPFTVASGVLALYVTGQVISISAIIGFVSLLGVSVMDGILILTYFKELRLLGKSAEDAIFEAYVHRMRPLLMTALSACIGLFPAAMSHGIGSQVQRPLATVVVGGMLLGPVFLLLVVPAMRLLALRNIQLKRRRKGLGETSMLKHTAKLWPVVLCAALAGCAVGPDFKAPEPTQASGFTRAPLDLPAGLLDEGQAVSAQWWTAYQSPEINRLVAQALARNPTVDAALFNLRAAQENVKAQQGLFYPTVQAGYNVSRQNSGPVVASPLASGDPLYTLHTAQLSVGFVPDLFGGNKRQVESLDAQAASQHHQLGALRVTIASNVVAAALQAASLQEQVRVVQEVVDVNRRQRDHLRGLKAAGYSSGADLATQELAYAQAVAQVPPLRKQLEQTRDMLAILCGSLPNEPLPQVQLDAVSTPSPLPLSLPSQIVEQRPDVQAAQEQLRASNALIGVAEANTLPQVSLTAGLGFSQGMLAGLFSPDNRTWGLSAGLLQPIFAGGALQARKRAAEATAQSAAAQYRSTVLTAFQNVADALYAIESDGQAVQAAKDVELASERLLTLAQKQVDLGYASGFALLGVRQAYLQARVARVAALGTYLGDTVALHQALGGGWTKTTP